MQISHIKRGMVIFPGGPIIIKEEMMESLPVPIALIDYLTGPFSSQRK